MTTDPDLSSPTPAGPVKISIPELSLIVLIGISGAGKSTFARGHFRSTQVRLLLAAAELLRSGQMPLEVGEHRERLLEIKRGEVPWDDVERRLRLQAEVDEALRRSPLPPAPDVAAVDAWLVSVRRRDL